MTARARSTTLALGATLLCAVGCSSAPTGTAPHDVEDSGDSGEVYLDADADAARDPDATSDPGVDTADAAAPPPTLVVTGLGEAQHLVGPATASIANAAGVDGVTFAFAGRNWHDDEAPFEWLIDGAELPDGAYPLVATLTRTQGPDDVREVTLRVDRSAPTVDVLAPAVVPSGAIDGMLDIAVHAIHPAGLLHVAVDMPEAPEFSARWDFPDGVLAETWDVSALQPGAYEVRFVAESRAGTRSEVTAFFLICDPTTRPCAGSCVASDFFDREQSHCGGCGIACDPVAEVCDHGTCACVGTVCDDGCTDLQTDPANCGACGVACGDDQRCVGGACEAPPADGWVLIPPGSFTMGYDEDDAFPAGNSLPGHEVTLTRGFWMQETEVTVAEWEAEFGTRGFESTCPDCPVTEISWWEALAYANALSVRDGLTPCYLLGACDEVPPGFGLRCGGLFVDAPNQSPYRCTGYRLPTEAEWEYAARGRAPGHTPGGDLTTLACYAPATVDDAMWSVCNTPGEDPQPVGQRTPNAFGIYDALGNAAEWVGDYWHTYEDAPVVDPFHLSVETGFRPIRGGNVRLSPLECRSAERDFVLPEAASSLIGFRLARTAP